MAERSLDHATPWPVAITRAFAELGEERAVIKPAVGASGHHVYKVGAGNLEAVVARVVSGVWQES